MFHIRLFLTSWILLFYNYQHILCALTAAPENTLIEVGQDAYLYCSADDVPAKWTFNIFNPSGTGNCVDNGTTICNPVNERYEIIRPTTTSTQKDLKIEKATTADAGTYSCEDMDGGDPARSAELYVVNKPVCTGTTTVTNGVPANIDLTCTITYGGANKIVLAMKQGTTALANGVENYLQFTSNQIKYTLTAPDQTTTYTCSVSSVTQVTPGANAADNPLTYSGTCTHTVVVPVPPTTTAAPTPAAPAPTPPPAAGNGSDTTTTRSGGGGTSSGVSMRTIIIIIAAVCAGGILIAVLFCAYIMSSSKSSTTLPRLSSTRAARPAYERQAEPRRRKENVLSRVLSRGSKNYF